MKGPNAKMPCIDQLADRLKMNEWNNIPIPIKEAFEEIVGVFVELKKCYFSNFNSI